MYWVYNLPNWLLGVLIVMVFVAASVSGWALVQRAFARVHADEHAVTNANSLVGVFFSASVGLYGISLGLISVATWQTFGDVEAKSGAEAAAVAALYRDLSAYPVAERTAFQSEVREYTRYVIHDAWPIQRRGEMPLGDADRLTRLQTPLFQYEPKTAGQVALHQEALSQFNKVVELRRRRLQTISCGLPAAVWAIVLLGALLSMGTTWLFRIHQRRTHMLLVAVYAALVGLLVFLTAAMDNPYRGEFSVGPAAFEQVYEQLMQSN
jgi:Protein of unknown function (DUF4239)